MHSARCSGKKKFISAGASVPGVIWNTMRMPSTVSSCPVRAMSTVGGISVTVPERGRLPEAGADLAARPLRQQRAVHVRRAAGHRAAGVDVLADRVLEEALGREDRDAARRDVLLGDDAARAAEVVDVAVRVEQAGHRPLAAMLAVERQRGGRRLGGDQRVDHEDARVALDDRHVREVEAAHLVDALGHLEQAVDRVQLPLAPEARVHRLRAVRVEEPVGVRVPDDAPVGRRGSPRRDSEPIRPRRASSKSSVSANGSRRRTAAFASAM